LSCKRKRLLTARPLCKDLLTSLPAEGVQLALGWEIGGLGDRVEGRWQTPSLG
jgi:hypothetical protein